MSKKKGKKMKHKTKPGIGNGKPETLDPGSRTQDFKRATSDPEPANAFAAGKKPPLTSDGGSVKLFTWEVLRAHKKGMDVLPSIHGIIDVLQPGIVKLIEPQDAANLRKIVTDHIGKKETADQTIRVIIDYLELDYAGMRNYSIATGILIEAAEKEETQGKILALLAEVIEHGAKPSAKNTSIAALHELLDKGIDIRDALFRLTWIFTKQDDAYNIRTNAIELWEAAAEKLDLSPAIPELISQGALGPQAGSAHPNYTYRFLAFLASTEKYRKQIMDEFGMRWRQRGNFENACTFFHAAISQGLDLSHMAKIWVYELAEGPKAGNPDGAFELLNDAAQKCEKSTRDAIAIELFGIIKSKQFAKETELNTRYYEQLVTRIAKIMTAITIGEMGEMLENLEAEKQAIGESK